MSIDFRQLTEHLERIYSRRIALRPVSLADAWALYEATRNPLFNQHLLWEQPRSEEDVLQRVNAIVDASRRGQMAALSAVVKKTGEWVSMFRFQTYAADPAAMEMGIWTHDRFWQGRYSVELSHLCVDAAFATCGVDKLVGASSPDNRSSCRLMESCGMKPMDIVTRRTETGATLVLQEYVATRSEWLKVRPRAVDALNSFPTADLGMRFPSVALAKPLEHRLRELCGVAELQAA